METRSSHLAVGVFVLVLSIGIALAAVWLAKRQVDAERDLYAIAFSGSVQGLQEGSSVLYRGVPVGRVEAIRIDPDNVDRVLATIEVEGGTPVKADTQAELVLQGVTGLSNIELTGGSNDSPFLQEVAEADPPVIEAGPSAIEQVFQSTPELLAQASILIGRLGRLVSDDNLAAIEAALGNVAAVTGTVAERKDEIGRFIEDGRAAMARVEQVAGALETTLTETGELTGTLAETVEAVREESGTAIGELERAAGAFRNLAWRADRTLEGLEQPIDDFGQSGLYDFSQLVREMRQLTAALNRITTEFERDPTGFLLGGNRRGFTPE